MRVKQYDSIMDTDNLEALRCPVCVDCGDGGKPEYSLPSTGEKYKILEKFAYYVFDKF